MIIELDKKALISLVCGNEPHKSLCNTEFMQKFGRYNDNRGWTWNKDSLEKFSEQELHSLYLSCRLSWK